MASTYQPGVIEPGALYALDEFKARTGFGAHAMREARRKGLRVKYIAGRGFVLGRDAIEFIEGNAKDQK